MSGLTRHLITLGSFLLAALAGPSQADATWQTTKTTVGGFNSGACGLERGSLRVKVHASHLDVEEELEVSTLGAVDAGNDPNTLEIVGTFTLPAGSTLVGGLLWDGDRMLESKLLDRKAADSLYEKMVQRNSSPPPRPRDPLILELVGKDSYRLRIYPVKLGGSRRFRLRYQLPPRIGAEGLEMRLLTVSGGLFPGLATSIPATLEPGGDVRKTVLVEGQGRVTLELPRTRFFRVQDLGQSGHWDGWSWSPGSSILLLPVDPLRQVMVKTRFDAGTFAGHYLNLYATVDDAVIKALGQRVEVVVLWKWHNPSTWLQRNEWGSYHTDAVRQAQAQAEQLLQFHDALGTPGIKVGLLHDDSRSAPRGFKAASRGEEEYARSGEYLRSLQGNYVADFVNGIRLLSGGKPNRAADVQASKDRFQANLRLVRTLYSAETGVVRHLVLVSAGHDYVVEERDMNAAFADLLGGPVSVAGFAGAGFAQAGFDLWEARRDHPYRGTLISTAWGEVPGLPPMNLNVVVRNERKAYDFGIRCEGGLGMSCGSLEFHGKSDSPWSDSLEWEAFDLAGKALGKAKTGPVQIGRPGDTAIATLWAGSDAPFSEKKELPLGPVYGFVDRWASMLALEKDSLGGDRARLYADTGVPRIANKDIRDVVPNYAAGQGPGNPGNPTSIADLGAIADPSAWRFERSGSGELTLRVPGLEHGRLVRLEVFDIQGRRIGSWSLRSHFGALRWKGQGLVPGGLYLLKLQSGAWSGSRKMAL